MRKLWKSNSLFCLLFFAANLVQAQAVVTNPLGLLKNKPGLIYGLDNRRTHLFDNPVSIYGLYCGAGFGENRLRLKFGVNISNRFVQPTGHQTEQASGRLFFINIGEELTVLSIKRHLLITHVNLGIGQHRYTIMQPDNPVRNISWIMPLETGLLYGFRVNSWLTPVVGGGWRWILFEPVNDLDGYYLKIGAKVDIKALRARYCKQ